MAELYYLPQFKQVNLVAPAGITAVQTTGIQLSNVDGIDITKPGLICITWAIALDTSVAEWVTYTSIDANNELVGVTRGAEGYSAKEHLSNAVIAWVFSKSHINNLNDNYLVQHNSDGTHKAATVTTLKTSGAEINAGTEDAKIVTPKSIADSYISNVYNSLYRQALINGNFDVWQRGTSFVPGVAAYCADRFQSYRAAVGSTVSRQTAALNGSTYSLRAQRDSSNSATDPIFITHSLPSSDSMKLRGQKVTFSFWAKCGANYSATSTGLYFIVQSGTGTDQNINGGLTNAATVVTNTVTLTTSWQKFTATSSAVLADTVNQLGLYFRFTPTGTAGANDWFEITQLQLCAGDVALPFMPKSFEEELRACQRYYEKSYTYSVTPGASVDATGISIGKADTTADSFGLSSVFKVRKRAIPTVVIYSYNGTANKMCVLGATTDVGTSITEVRANEVCVSSLRDSGAGLTAGTFYWFHWTASAEL